MYFIHQIVLYHQKIFVILELMCVIQDTFCQKLEMTFYSDTICDVKRKIHIGCSVQVPKIHNKIQCVSLCGRDERCIGASLDKQKSCFKHFQCSNISTCASPSDNHSYLTKQCAHGGTLDSSTCRCVNGWVGKTCRDLPSSCADLIKSGYPEGCPKVLLKPDSSSPDTISAVCCIAPKINYYNLYLMKNDGHTDWNRTWKDYRDGFENPEDGSIWIGLKNWHALSKIGYNHLFIVCTIEGLGQMYRQYKEFVLSSEDEEFYYTHGASYENRDNAIVDRGYKFSDCMYGLQGMVFSTWDRYNDAREDQNCASSFGSGWWYYFGCYNPCNILGWGTAYWDTKPRNQLISLLGLDIEKERSRKIEFEMYLIKKK